MIWRRERLPTPVSWPGEFHGLYKSVGLQRVGHNFIYIYIFFFIFFSINTNDWWDILHSCFFTLRLWNPLFFILSAYRNLDAQFATVEGNNKVFNGKVFYTTSLFSSFWLHCMWDLSSPARGWTLTPCSRSTVSSPLDHQGKSLHHFYL